MSGINDSKNDIKDPLIGEEEGVVKQSKDQEPGVCSQILSVLSSIKIIVMVAVVFYAWLWTGQQREDNYGVLDMMCYESKFPEQIIFHHERIIGSLSFSTENKTKNLDQQDQEIRDRIRQDSKTHYPAKNMQVYTFKKEKSANGKIEEVPVPTPKLSSNLIDATQRIAKAEMFDKTWILLFILTICWSKWHNDNKEHESEEKDELTGDVLRIIKKDGKLHGHIVGFHTNPMRIFVPSAIGMILINLKSILDQKNLYMNEIRLFVCIILVGVLVSYMYSICSQHLENITSIERQNQKQKQKKESQDTTDLLDEFQKKEQKNKVIRKIQRDLAIRYDLLTKLDSRVRQNVDQATKDGKSVDRKEINLNTVDDLFKEMAGDIPKEVIDAELQKSARRQAKREAQLDGDEVEEDDDMKSEDLSAEAKNEMDVPETYTESRMSNSDDMSQLSAAAKRTKKGVVTIINIILYNLSLAATDIFFGIFMMTQELDDTSFLKTFELRALFDKPTLCMAVIIVHAGWAFVIVGVTYIFCGLLMSQSESNIFGCIIIYIIVMYEFLFHILYWSSQYLQIS